MGQDALVYPGSPAVRQRFRLTRLSPSAEMCHADLHGLSCRGRCCHSGGRKRGARKSPRAKEIIEADGQINELF